ncbi:hypothetical protein [Aquimarina macrocephali]|uniref:hypothetical protein n=1 Tax=Aquimarina macrocephali TaxID=666563 RepID=UPI003F679B97
MTTLIYIILFLSIWHLFYEAVVAPSLRHGLRYEFFKLRDKLRNLEMKGLSKKDEVIYDVLDHTICDIVYSMHYISIVNYFKLKNSELSDKKTKDKLKEMIEFMNTPDNPELKEIDHEMNKLASKILFINAGAWSMYLIPLLPLLSIFHAVSLINGKIKSLVYKVSSRLIYFKEKIYSETEHMDNNISMI